GFMVDQRGIEAAEGFLHLFEGWVIFGACVAILFLMAIAMQRLSPNPKPLADTIDLEFDGLGAQAARVTTHVPSAALIAGALMTTAVSTAWVAAPQPETVRLERSPFAVFPRTLGDWSGNNAYLEPDIEAVLGADDYYSAFYHRDGDETGVDLFIAYYHKLTEGEGIHSPEVCIPTAGWEIAGMEVEVVEIPGSGWPPFPVNRAIIEKGLNQQLVYFWFEQRGRRLTNDYAAKAYTILDSLSMGRTDGALVRVITPILEGEGEASAEARLQALLTDALPVLPQFIPDETAQIR
ncbi:MAG: exosortase C-terminal domain/associated protein EpsI, partial [Pseudomonadota bacterium]